MAQLSEEARRIVNNCAKVPLWHGTTTVDIVDEILGVTGGQIFCNGRLRDFVFTPLTPKTYSYKTEDWYDKTYGH